MLRRACLGALRSTPACMSGIGLSMHSGMLAGSCTHSLPYFRRRYSGLPLTCKLPVRRIGRNTPILLRTCSAFAYTTTAGDATRNEQHNVTKFVHNLSQEQAAAALAGDGHLRYTSVLVKQFVYFHCEPVSVHPFCTCPLVRDLLCNAQVRLGHLKIGTPSL